MSHAVTYVLKIEGKLFNTSGELQPAATDDELGLLSETDSTWDGTLRNTTLLFNAELTGAVTIIWLATKYSVFLDRADVRIEVSDWENNLRRIFPKIRIVRLDELLLQEWEKRAGEFWFRNAGLAERFYDWITSQPRESWATIE